jgi:hypothetical protein
MICTRPKRVAAMIAVVLTLLSGCAHNPGAATDSASPSASSAPVTAAPVAADPVAADPVAADPVAADPVVTLLRTGGFAGVHDQVSIARDGGWTVTDRAGATRTGRLTDQQRDALRRLAADLRLAHESTRKQGPSRCADAYAYTLTVDELKIAFIDCPDEDLPQAAKAVTELVTRIVGG